MAKRKASRFSFLFPPFLGDAVTTSQKIREDSLISRRCRISQLLLASWGGGRERGGACSENDKVCLRMRICDISIDAEALIYRGRRGCSRSGSVNNARVDYYGRLPYEYALIAFVPPFSFFFFQNSWKNFGCAFGTCTHSSRYVPSTTGSK
jgi:hypothetical protein